MAKLKSVSNMNWSERLSLIDHYQPTDDQICQVFGVTKDELDTARELRQVGSLKPSEFIDVNEYGSLFDGTADNTSVHSKGNNNEPRTMTATKHERPAKKRGRKGTKIAKAFEAVPTQMTPAEEFAEQYNISLAVLRQSKRFDPYNDELGPVRVKKDKDSNQLMVWREQS